MRLILASASPRRRELLQEAGYDFTVDPVKVSEIIDENLNPSVNALDIARRKGEVARSQDKYLKLRDYLILSADTLVVLDGKALGKPKNSAEARLFLSSLSGKMHSVITAIWLGPDQGPAIQHLEETKVQFRILTDQEIQDYIATGEPMDKAGAYAIQGLGGKFVSKFSGSWSNVVGLPMESFERLVKENGWNLCRNKA